MKIALFEDLRRVHDLRGGWDVVLFTGDMVFSGKVEEYAELDTRLSELWVMFGELGCAPALYVVPGNHDLTRSTRPSAAERMLLQPGQYTPVRDELFRGNEPDGRKAIDDAFAHYSEWAESCPHMDNSISPGCLPGDFVATVCKDGIRLGLAGLNTAFLQLAGDETVRQLTGAAQEGHLDLHPQQLLDACENDPERWAVGHHACLLMTHHPPSWLSDAGTEALHADIGPAGRFAVQLCGHVHATLRREVSEGGADVRRLWQNRSMFGLERCDNGATERVHGYAVGSIEFSENTGSLRF